MAPTSLRPETPVDPAFKKHMRESVAGYWQLNCSRCPQAILATPEGIAHLVMVAGWEVIDGEPVCGDCVM